MSRSQAGLHPEIAAATTPLTWRIVLTYYPLLRFRGIWQWMTMEMALMGTHLRPRGTVGGGHFQAKSPGRNATLRCHRVDISRNMSSMDICGGSRSVAWLQLWTRDVPASGLETDPGFWIMRSKDIDESFKCAYFTQWQPGLISLS
jgi:hypothetical protein